LQLKAKSRFTSHCQLSTVNPPVPSTPVIFIHGLWLTGVESTLLRRRLGAELGCTTCAFHYPSVTASMDEVLARLHEFVASLRAETLHFIGHSLGGIVVLRYLESRRDVAPGRAVLLGSPLAGSRAAQGLARWPVGAAILGRNIEAEVLKPQTRHWDRRRDLGIIAGDLSLGFGRLVSQLGGPNDGTVAVAETQLAGVTDHIVLPISHTGMLFSAAVAHQAAHFLLHGRFERAEQVT
jgi:pimeloyl-ACP methyl ester carboxylesterase